MLSDKVVSQDLHKLLSHFFVVRNFEPSLLLRSVRWGFETESGLNSHFFEHDNSCGILFVLLGRKAKNKGKWGLFVTLMNQSKSGWRARRASLGILCWPLLNLERCNYTWNNRFSCCSCESRWKTRSCCASTVLATVSWRRKLQDEWIYPASSSIYQDRSRSKKP